MIPKAFYGTSDVGLPTSEERNSGQRVLDSLPPFSPRKPKQYLDPERAEGLIEKNVFNTSTL
jgi:hypothetical protein